MGITRNEVAAAVREIIQADLKFSGVDLPDDLELVGGGLALDSLDLLMLITGIEKRFGLKVSQRKLDQETMSSIGAFVDFTHRELMDVGR